MFRFEAHYHPYGEQTFDRMRVGIKFYPKGVVPTYVVTSHRIRTGVGNDWVLNRERIEDLLLARGLQAVDRRTVDADRRAHRGEPAARGGLPQHSAQHGRAPRALLAAAEAGARHQLPAAHALPRLAHAARGDSSGRTPRDAHRRDALRADVAGHLQIQGAAPASPPARSSTRCRGTTTPRTTSTTPIRRRGSAGAAAPWTKWATAGPTSRSSAMTSTGRKLAEAAGAAARPRPSQQQR